jgi:ubiquitin-protein ligase E3 B
LFGFHKQSSDKIVNPADTSVSNAFYRGLSDLISPSWLSLFNANEFNQVSLPSFIDTTESDLPFMDDARNKSKIS